MHQVASGYPDHLSAQQAWRLLKDPLEHAPTVAVGSTCTIEPIVPYLAAEFARRGLLLRPISLPYNSILQELIAGTGDLSGAVDALLLPRLDDLVPNPSWPLEDCLQVADQIVAALATFTARSDTCVWLGLFPPRCVVTFPGPQSEEATLSWHAANLQIAQGIRAMPSVHGFDTAGVLASVGIAGFSAKSWFLGRQPYSPVGLRAIASAAARAIVATKRPRRKILSLDCDGVLWGGVVDEDGWSGVKIGDDPVGRAHCELQGWARKLAGDGVVLALCSRNHPDDVWEVFDRREEMLLSRDDVSVTALNWEPKSENLLSIAEQVGVGVDAVVHVDDDPAVVAEIVSHLPETTPLLLPRDVSQIPAFLASQEFFDTGRLTSEDRRRVEMVSLESRRREHAKRLSPEEFLADLQLRILVRDADSTTSDRVVQLVHKTNQFNLTTKRHSRADLAQLLARPDWRCHTFTVADRFGDYGLTAVTIAGPDDDSLVIDSLLLSCRVIGRGVEQAVMAVLVEQASDLGLRRIRAQFIPTARNEPASDYLRQMNFNDIGAGRWELTSLDAAPGWPAHIEQLQADGGRAEGGANVFG